jgi:hypothetical protein
MSDDMDDLLDQVAQELCTNLFAAEVGSDLEAEITRETLKRRLLPLLEAGEDMRYQEWPKGPLILGPAKDWDDALAAALARCGGPDV